MIQLELLLAGVAGLVFLGFVIFRLINIWVAWHDVNYLDGYYDDRVRILL